MVLPVPLPSLTPIPPQFPICILQCAKQYRWIWSTYLIWLDLFDNWILDNLYSINFPKQHVLGLLNWYIGFYTYDYENCSSMFFLGCSWLHVRNRDLRNRADYFGIIRPYRTLGSSSNVLQANCPRMIYVWKGLVQRIKPVQDRFRGCYAKVNWT